MKLLKQVDNHHFYGKEPKELGSIAQEFQDFVKEYINPDLTIKDFEEQIHYGNLEGELQVLWEVYCAGSWFNSVQREQLERERREQLEAQPFVHPKLPLGLALVNGKVQPTYGKDILNVERCDLEQNQSEVIATVKFRVANIQNEKG